MNKVFLSLAILLSFGATAQDLKIQQSNWQQEVDYTIQVELNDELHTLNGDIAINYSNNSPDALTEFYFHAWPNSYQENSAFAKQQLRVGKTDFHFSADSSRGAMSITQWELDSEAVEVQWIQKDIFKVVLSEPIAPGQQVQWTGSFTVKIPGPFSRMGHVGQSYQITQWYPKPAVYDVNGWNPMPYLDQGEFYSEFGSFDVSITTPAEYVIGATGNIQDPEEKEWMQTLDSSGATLHPKAGGKKTVNFTQDRVHDFAWFASKNLAVEMKELEVAGKSYETWVMAPSPKKAQFKSSFDAIELALKVYGEEVGAYPFRTVKVVEGPIEAGGGMEYPTITVVASLGKEVIVHEVGHNWFYGVLGSNERRYPWMDESINSYIEFKAINPDLKDLNSAEVTTRSMIALAKNEIANGRGQSVGQESEALSRINYGVIIYGKGSILFGYLEGYLNSLEEGLFQKCMHAYYNEWQFKHPLPGDMEDVFERVSGKSLDWFFRELIHSEAPDWGLTGNVKNAKIKANVAYTMPIPVKYKFKDGSDTTIWVAADADPKSLSKKGVKSMQIDPLGLLVEHRVGNNSIRKGPFPPIEPIKLGVFTGFDGTGRSELYTLPLVAYNGLDKWMAGLYLTNKSISRKPVEWWVVPLYSFSNSTVNGLGGINYRSSKNSLEVGITLRRFTTFFGSERSKYTYNRVQPYLEVPWKSEDRTHVKSTVRLDANIQSFEAHFNEVDRFNDNRNPNAPFIGPRYFLNLTYLREDNDPISPSSLKAELQQGFVQTRLFKQSAGSERKEETEVDQFTRLQAVFSKRIPYGRKDKGLDIRVFGGYMIEESTSTYFTNYGLSSSSEAGRWDYEFDHLLIDRKANDGLWAQQIMPDGARSKAVGTLVTNAQWMASVTLISTVPGKIPVQLFAEATTWENIENSFILTGIESPVILLGGVQVSALKGALEINIPLVRNSVLTEYYDQVEFGFGRQITFVFNLEKLSPYNLVKDIRLF